MRKTVLTGNEGQSKEIEVMRKKRIFALILVVAFAMFAASCSSGTDTTDTTAASGGTATTVASGGTDTTVASGGGEKTVVTWLALVDWPSEVTEAAFEAANPDIDLVVEGLGFGELFEQIQIRMTAGDSNPDVLTVDGPRTSSYGLRGWILPLDSYFTDAEKADWWTESVDAGTYEGQLIGAPFSTSTQLLYYNKPLLDAAGIPYPGEDERLTWEQIAENAVKIKDATPSATGFNWEQMVQIYQLQPLAVSLGGVALGPDGLEAEGFVNSPEWVEAMTYYSGIYNDLEVAPQGEVLWTPDGFETGDVGLMVAGPWNIGRFSNSDVLSNDDWGVSRHPVFTSGEIKVPTGGWNLGINANSENVEAAARFVKWMTSPEGQRVWFTDGAGDPPSSRTVMDFIVTGSDYADWPGSAFQVMAKEAQAGPELRPVTVAYLEYEAIFSTAFQDIRNGADPKTALDAAAAQMDREFAKYKK